jgi:choline dehydrogenase-like flavoprotein
MSTPEATYDAVIVGSGVGGAMAAHRLVRAGWRVLVLERGPRVARGPHNWDPTASLELTEHYSRESAYRVEEGGHGPSAGSVFCLGGPSVFYGAAAIRFREADFLPDPEIAAESGARWPYEYADLEPYYCEAERVMGVAGDDSTDPTRPPRSAPYPQAPLPLFRVSSRFGEAARAAGVTPTPLPLAINYDASNGRTACTACRTCDTYACAIAAKNDMESAVLAPLMRDGLDVRTESVVTRIVARDGVVVGVEGWDKARGEPFEHRGRHVILAAGALASPHLLLASGLERLHPSGAVVGRYLTRHCSSMVIGFCNFRPDPEKVFHKQLIVFDYYFGDARSRRWAGRRLGTIQQITTPPAALMRAHMPWFPKQVPLHGFAEHLTGTLVMAEDEPVADNGVALDAGDRDGFGMPRLRMRHRYTRGDLRRRALLERRAKRILRRVGAWSFYTYHIKTFSHALGTVRMGVDEASSPLDADCRFRGLRNLLVVDGSALPTSAAVNPGLTIAANALRAADRLVQEDGR